MELRTLRYFLAAAQEKNITRAAEILHLTQPTLSRQLRELEEEDPMLRVVWSEPTRQIHVQLIAVLGLPHVGLHQVLGVLAVQRVAAVVPHGEHPKVITKEIIKQILTKNAGQHKSFLHSLHSLMPCGRSSFEPLFLEQLCYNTVNQHCQGESANVYMLCDVCS